VYTSSIPKNVKGFNISNEVIATDVYDNNNSKQMTRMMSLLIRDDIRYDCLAARLIIIKIKETASGCIKCINC